MTRNRTRKIYDPINVFYIFVGSPSRAFIDNQFSFKLWRVVARPFLILLSPFIFPSSMTSILLIIASTSSLLLLLWRKFSNNFFPTRFLLSFFHSSFNVQPITLNIFRVKISFQANLIPKWFIYLSIPREILFLALFIQSILLSIRFPQKSPSSSQWLNRWIQGDWLSSVLSFALYHDAYFRLQNLVWFRTKNKHGSWKICVCTKEAKPFCSLYIIIITLANHHYVEVKNYPPPLHTNFRAWIKLIASPKWRRATIMTRQCERMNPSATLY